MQRDFFRIQFLAINSFIAVVVGPERRAFERDAGEKPAGAGIGKHFRAQGYVRIRSASRPFGPAAAEASAPSFHFAVENRARAALVHYQQHEVGCLAAELKTETAALQSHHRGRTPRTRKSSPLRHVIAPRP